MAQFTFFGHAFGQTYTLPVPLWLFLFGAGVAVAVSFIAVALLVDDSLRTPTGRASKKLGPAVKVGRFVGILLLAVTIITGLAGTQDSIMNFSVTAFWVCFLLSFTYLVAIFGNLWKLINPFDTLLDGIEPLLRTKIATRSYPRRLGHWPALGCFYGLIWVELVGRGIGTTPRDLALLILGYLVMTLAASVWFGREAWFKYGELFSVFFGLVSKVSFVEIRNNSYSLRRPLNGLLAKGDMSLSLMLFILFMLASTGFDGLKETVVFGDSVSLLLGATGTNAYIVGSVGLVVTTVFLLAVYLIFVALTKWISQTTLTYRHLVYRFIYSLIPIAVAYHAAHYFTMVLITGQSIIPELSDPFGSGLNIFGTAGYHPVVGFYSASAVWYGELALIIMGHIGAVYISHKEALMAFSSRKEALRSQIPMIGLMILYTIGSLWIIAQPIAI